MRHARVGTSNHRWRRPARAVVAAVRGHVSIADALREAVGGPNVRVRSLERDARGPLVLLSPHLDDAVFSCWSVAARGGDVTVVNVFAAIPPIGLLTTWDRLTGATDSAIRMKERIAEDRAALSRAERSPVNLHFLAGDYRRRPPNIRTLLTALVECAPKASCVYAPAGIGGNGDHLLVTRLGYAIAASGVPVRLYADIPYAVTYGWPHWVTGGEIKPFVRPEVHWEPYLHGSRWASARLVPEVVVLSDDDRRAKAAAMQEYRSQLPAITGGSLDRLNAPAIGSFEVFWDVELDAGGE